MKYFVTAIGTDSGKTLVSAVLVKALNASYWKPVQAGLPTDSDSLRGLVKDVRILPERFKLSAPMSPHGAAAIDSVLISKHDFVLPKVEGNLIIEGAGGLLVPINDTETIADIVEQLNVSVVLVVNLYLGCINHALLTINELKRRGIRVAGIVFNGEGFDEAKSYIENYTSWPTILSIPKLDRVSVKEVEELAREVNF